jgi:hypothetical protein
MTLLLVMIVLTGLVVAVVAVGRRRSRRRDARVADSTPAGLRTGPSVLEHMAMSGDRDASKLLPPDYRW